MPRVGVGLMRLGLVGIDVPRVSGLEVPRFRGP